jgi:hypothetical protein
VSAAARHRSWAARAAIAVVAVALAAGPALADDKANAIALFDEGLREMKAGNYAKACKALEASNRLLSDSGTRGSLARCYTHLGRLASAWTLWRELADTAPSAQLRSDAAAQAKKLEPRLARYRVKLAESMDGIAVTVAGDPIDLSTDIPVPIDPGTYPVEAKAPGHVAWSGQLTAKEGVTAEIAVPALAPAAAAARPVKPPTSKKPAVASAGRGRRIAGGVIAGLGLGGLAASGVFGAMARSDNEDAKKICGGAIDRCDPARTDEAQRKVDDARSAARISTIAAAAGGALVVTGIILYVTAPKAERRSVAIAPLVDGTMAGLSLSGRY